jgi:DNA replication protein DnaC
MEKIRIDIQLNPAQVMSRQQLMQSLKENEDVLAFLSKHQLDTSFVEKYVGKFSDYVEVCNTCKKCNGLKNCPYGIQGEYRDLDVQNGKLVITSKMCSYLKEHDNRFAHMKQYVMNHLREDLYEVDFNKIALENESIDYLKSYALIKEWSIHPTKGLYFYGGFGVGKTYLAACVANELISKCIPCLVTNFARIANEVSGMFDGKQQYYDNLNSFPLLVIDDLSAERDSSYMNEIVYYVINTWTSANKPLIVTTNLTGEELKRPKDTRNNRVYSRLFEKCIPYEVKGNHRRNRECVEYTKKFMKGIK